MDLRHSTKSKGRLRLSTGGKSRKYCKQRRFLTKRRGNERMTSANGENQIGEIVLVNIKEEQIIPEEVPQDDPLAGTQQNREADGKSAENVLDDTGQLTSSPGTPGDDLTCAYCAYRAPYRSTLQVHVRTHTGEKPFACDKCSYRASRLNLLKGHARTHTCESYACDECDYKTSYFNRLEKHRSTHTGNPYICNSCGYRTKFLNHLKGHMRTHTGERPYACGCCDYRAGQLGTLKAHMRTHTGEKPYSCDTCGHRTSHPSALRIHMRAHKDKKAAST